MKTHTRSSTRRRGVSRRPLPPSDRPFLALLGLVAIWASLLAIFVLLTP